MESKKKDTTKHKKENIINLRVTEKELSAINSRVKKAKINRSSYILQAILNEKVLTNIDIQVVFQLRKIGVNLNQITKQIHIISKFVDKKEDKLPDILKEITFIEQQIQQLNDQIINNNALKS